MMKAIYRVALIGTLVLLFAGTINSTVFADGKTFQRYAYDSPGTAQLCKELV